MSLLLKCKCGKTLSVKPEMAGKKGKCPGCGALFTIPAPAKPASPKMEDPFDIPFANTNASQASGSFWNELQRSTASTTGNSTSEESGAVANRNANRSSNNYLENANREAKERERRERDQENANGTSQTLIAFIGILITGGLIFGAYTVSTRISTPEFMKNFRSNDQTANINVNKSVVSSESTQSLNKPRIDFSQLSGIYDIGNEFNAQLECTGIDFELINAQTEGRDRLEIDLKYLELLGSTRGYYSLYLHFYPVKEEAEGQTVLCKIMRVERTIPAREKFITDFGKNAYEKTIAALKDEGFQFFLRHDDLTNVQFLKDKLRAEFSGRK